MTISSEDARTGPYNGNGVTTEFAYDFKVLDQSHLVVTLKNSSDVETVQTITTNYTVAGVGDAGGGTITMVTPPASGETLTISRSVPLTQEVDLANRGGVQPEVLETAYDKLTQALQDQEELHARVPRFPVSSSLTEIELPLTLTANAVLAVNAAGTAFINGPTSANISSAQSYADAAEAALDEFTDLYLGSKASDPTLDNDGNALQDGALYFDTTLNVMKVYDLGTTTWKRTTPTTGEQANIDIVAADGTDIGTVAGISANVTTVAGISSDVTAVAGDATDIGTVATDLAGSDTIGTVAGIAANVTTVAGISSDVTTVAADGTDIGTVAGISANVTTVAGISSDVTTVAGISSDVTTVAADGTDIGTVATNIADVNTVAGVSSDVTTVAGISSDVTTVAADGTDIGTVSTNIANVNTVAGISGNVTTVAGISPNVTTVAGVSSDVTTVAGVSSDVTTVAGISGDVTTVAADGTDIGTVATNISNVNTVAGNNANVTTVAGVSSNVTTVAGISSDVTSVAGVASDVTTVAGISSDVSAVAAQVVGYAFSTTTTMADPGSGNVRFNNATLASVTAIAIDDLDSNGVDQSAYIALWDDSTNTIKGTLVFRTVGGDVATFNITGLTDNAGWFELAVTHVASSGTFSNAEDTFVGFTRAGDKGADGAGSGDVSGPGASVTDNAVVRWDSTSGQLVQNSSVIVDDSGTLQTLGGFAAQGTGLPGSGSGVEINFGLVAGEGTVQAFDRDLSAWEQLRLRGNQVAFDISGSEKVRIDTSGNVGIGTSSPTLISGYPVLSIGSGTGGSILEMNEPGGAIVRLISDTNGFALTTDGTGVGNGNIRFKAGQITSATDAHITIATTGNVGIGTSSPGNSRLAVLNGGGQAVLSVRDSANGRVQIGTTDFGVSNSSAADLQITNQALSGTVGMTLNVGDATNSGNIYWRSDTSNNTVQIVGNPGNNYLAFATSAGEKVRIDSSGQVGIGTSSPAQALDVVTASSNAYIRVARNALAAGQAGLQINGGTGGVDWYLFQNTGSNDLTVFGNGATEFTVGGGIFSGNAAGPALLNEAAAFNNPTIAPLKTDTATGWGSGGANNIDGVVGGTRTVNFGSAITAFYNTSGHEFARLDRTNNRFGIGTTGPAYNLDVTGDINFTGTLYQNGSAFGGLTVYAAGEVVGGTTTFSRAVWTDVTFTETADSGTTFDGTTFTVPAGEGGVYELIAWVEGDYNSIGNDGEAAGIRFDKNSGTILAEANFLNLDQADRNQVVNTAYMGSLAAGDTIVVEAKFNDGNGSGNAILRDAALTIKKVA